MVGWLVGWFEGDWSVHWLIGWCGEIGWLIGWLGRGDGWFVDWSIGLGVIGWFVDWLVGSRGLVGPTVG